MDRGAWRTTAWPLQRVEHAHTHTYTHTKASLERGDRHKDLKKMEPPIYLRNSILSRANSKYKGQETGMCLSGERNKKATVARME